MKTGKHKEAVKNAASKPKGDNGQAKRNERYQKEWLKIFMLLLEYKAKHGHVDVPAREKFKGIALGNWVVRQRTIKKQLPKEHRSLLNKAGLNWDPNGEEWNRRFQMLYKFYEKNGHTYVPINYKKYPELARWVHMQRKYRIMGFLSDDKIRKLNHLHFIWDARMHLWINKLEQLKAFYNANGHFFIPHNQTNKSLSEWKNQQIRFYKTGKLSNERFEMLKEIGFDLTNKSIYEVNIVQGKNGQFVREASV